jgi:hypothetical protein
MVQTVCGPTQMVNGACCHGDKAAEAASCPFNFIMLLGVIFHHTDLCLPGLCCVRVWNIYSRIHIAGYLVSGDTRLIPLVAYSVNACSGTLWVQTSLIYKYMIFLKGRKGIWKNEKLFRPVSNPRPQDLRIRSFYPNIWLRLHVPWAAFARSCALLCGVWGSDCRLFTYFTAVSCMRTCGAHIGLSVASLIIVNSVVDGFRNNAVTYAVVPNLCVSEWTWNMLIWQESSSSGAHTLW